MTSQTNKIAQLLRNWKGEDSIGPTTCEQVAQQIDQEYEKYLASLPAMTAAIKAGQETHERRVA